MEQYRVAYPGLTDQLAQALAGELPAGWETHLPVFTPADGEMATRDAGGAVINAVAGFVTNLVGGSADLDPSTRTTMKGCGDFRESPDGPVRSRGADTGDGRRCLGVRRTEHSFRPSRARHGRGDDRNGPSRWASPVWRDVPVGLGVCIRRATEHHTKRKPWLKGHSGHDGCHDMLAKAEMNVPSCVSPDAASRLGRRLVTRTGPPGRIAVLFRGRACRRIG